MTQKTFEKYKAVIDQWFVNGFNGAKAYRSLYPKAKRADDSFSKIQSIPEVAEYVKVKHKEAEKELRTTHKVLLKELENWAYSDITETIGLTPEQVKELPEEVRRLVNKYKHTQRHLRDSEGNIFETIDIIELHFVSKEKAMEMIHKHTGFYEKDNEQKTTNITMFRIPENGRN